MNTPPPPRADEPSELPELEFVPGAAARMPTKRVAAGALILDAAGRVLLVEPTYKPNWEIPGGVVEAGEDPVSACRRELLEELGVVREPGRLLVVDWVPPGGPWSDALNLIFDGGRVDETDLARMRPPADEVRSLTLVAPADLDRYVAPAMARRLVEARAALTDGRPRYLQGGRPVG